MNLFNTVLDGMLYAQANDVPFLTWSSASEVIEIYAPHLDCDEKELKATTIALNAIIESNGSRSVIQAQIYKWNMIVWGKNFVNESGNVAYNG